MRSAYRSLNASCLASRSFSTLTVSLARATFNVSICKRCCACNLFASSLKTRLCSSSKRNCAMVTVYSVSALLTWTCAFHSSLCSHCYEKTKIIHWVNHAFEYPKPITSIVRQLLHLPYESLVHPPILMRSAYRSLNASCLASRSFSTLTVSLASATFSFSICKLCCACNCLPSSQTL